MHTQSTMTTANALMPAVCRVSLELPVVPYRLWCLQADAMASFARPRHSRLVTEMLQNFLKRRE